MQNLTTPMPWVPENQFVSQLTHNKLRALSIIYLFTGILSLVGSCSIVVISVKRKVVYQRTVLPLFQLCVADMLGSFGIVVGALTNNLLKQQFPSPPWQRNFCVVVTMFTTTSFMVAFLLTINYALQTYIVLNDRLNISPNTIFAKILGLCNWARVFPLISWIFPFAFAIFIVFIDSHWRNNKQYYDLDDDICTWCFPLFFYENGASCPASTERSGKEKFDYYRMYKATFLAFIAITILSVIVLFYLVFKRFKQLLVAGGVIGRNQYLSIEKVRNRTFTLFGALFVCWIFPLVLGLLSLQSSFKMKIYYPFYVVEALTSPMQGFLNSIIYGWYNVHFRDTIRYDGGFDGERRPLLDPTAEPPTNHKRSYTNKSPISEIISAPNSDAGNEENDELW